jgi:enterochelin esterase-like enzyme
MRTRIVGAAAAALVLAGTVVGVPRAPAAEFAAECAPPTDAPQLVVGVVACQRFDSAALGGTTAFGYYIPPACAPPADCPVLYYLHGTGGSYTEGVGRIGSTPGEASAWVRALTTGPDTADVRSHPAPWELSDPAAWVARPSIDLIIVSPYGRVVPGGYGPRTGHNAFWFDWNPRYAAGGDTPQYDTPAPRFHGHLVDELVPYVDATFPTGGGREQRAIVGYSMGGIGALANGLRHPDVWASVGAQSGGGFPYGTTTGLAPAPVGVAPPAEVPYQPLPGVVPTLGDEVLWDQTPHGYGSVVAGGFGDPVADNVWWRQTQASELVTNARARAGDGRQSVHVAYFVQDAVPRRAEDLEPGRESALYFEAILLPTNRQLDALFERHGVERQFRVGPGTHSGDYARPYFREQLELQYANLRHRDGTGAPPPLPATFDHRTIDDAFTIWGWRFTVTDRAATEFLYLTDVSCGRVTLRGTGTVTFTVPGRCGGGSVASRTHTVDLGPSQPTDEPLTQSVGSDGYGRTVTVELTPTGT